MITNKLGIAPLGSDQLFGLNSYVKCCYVLRSLTF